MATKRTTTLAIGTASKISKQLAVWPKSVKIPRGQTWWHRNYMPSSLHHTPSLFKTFLCDQFERNDYFGSMKLSWFVLPCSLCVCVCLPSWIFKSICLRKKHTFIKYTRVFPLPILGMVIPPLVGEFLWNPFIGYINPDYWVDQELPCKQGHPWQPTKGRRMYGPPWLLPATCWNFDGQEMVEAAISPQFNEWRLPKFGISQTSRGWC